ncbi:Na+/H+ antiporter family protein [Blautia hansenii]|uniref:Na+/H+ antiporter family protein n=1 Tax=Blautia hansenii TaxID=1322 RepID=UPI0022E30F5E|nr:SLC13 family permease [Blautia hansenii]
MENLLNPVVIAVVLLCVLCLLKINVLLSMLVSLFVAGLVGGMGIVEIKDSLLAGLGGNGETALAYILLGTLAACMATTGITEILSKKIAKVVGGNKWVMILTLLIIACLSQNLIPIHIAYIPILVPPLLVLMNKMRLDRRGVACTIAFGHKAPYIAIPFGFGAIFMGIICDNINLNVKEDWGWDKVTMGDVTAVNWILAVAMLIGLAIALFITYRKPRDYKDVQIEGVKETGNLKLEYKHWVVLAALVVVVAIQIWCGSLPVAALGGLLVIFVFRAIDPKDIDAQFQEGIKLMGFIAFVMLVAGGFAQVIKDTGAVDELVKSSVSLMGGSRWIAATVITLIGLLVTMGIGTSFGTVPVLAVLYVPLCHQVGFSPAATIVLMSAAAALGDAGSPASDTTLGPTSGLNADGQHDHIWDTCVPTFLHFNIPLMIAAIVAAQFL